jgi:predicted kinase
MSQEEVSELKSEFILIFAFKKFCLKLSFRIIIFIRGAPGSGKSYLANQILQYEKKNGNKRIKFCTPNIYYAKDKFIRDSAEKYVDNLHSEVLDLLKEGFYSFIIVEYEGSKMDVYNKLADAAKLATYEIYGIDVIQPVDTCIKYLKHGRARKDIEDIAKEIMSSPVPYYHKIIDPIELIEPGWKAAQPPPKPKSPSPPPRKRYVPPKQTTRGRFYDSDDDSDDDCFSCHG